MKPNRRKPSVSIIGAGRLGQALALALSSAGYPIVALVARHARKAEKAAALLPKTKAIGLGATQLRDLPDCDLVIISTPDDAIGDLARKLAGLRKGGGIVLHTSGALSSSILKPLAKIGFGTGSIHPLVSVSEPRAGAEALRGAYFCVEGDRRAIAQARRIVGDLKGVAFSIKSESKPLYHAAAVMASPNLVALFDLATEMLEACGLSNRNASKVLLPLVESTVENLKLAKPAKALTGTFARGDFSTVKKHLSALSKKEHKDALQIYRLLGLRSLRLAERNGLDTKLIQPIRKRLRQ
jgi:predicted short-subunit dehydrogenase-like oxidoreductase (DUF2520 family)